MNNLVNKLNEYLKIFNADGINFENYGSLVCMWMMLPSISPLKYVDMRIYEQFNNTDDFFKKITPIYNEILTRREIDCADISKYGKSTYIFAYHMVNIGALSFLKTLSLCSSLKEFELKLQVMGYEI